MSVTDYQTQNGFGPRDAIDFISELGGAELLTSTIGLALPDVTVSVWQVDRLVLNMPPADYHMLGLGLYGVHQGHQSYDQLQGPEEITISPGGLFYVPAGQSVLFSGKGDGALIYLMLESTLMDQATLEASNSAIQTAEGFAGFNRRTLPRLTTLALSVFRELSLARPGFEQVIGGAVKMIASDLSRDRLATLKGEKPLADEALEESRVAAIVEMIEADLNEPVNAEALSARFGLGQALIARGFEAATGTTLSGYRDTARANRAFFMLESGKYTIDDIVKAAGFETEAHLEDGFEAEFGYSVTETWPKMMMRRTQS